MREEAGRLFPDVYRAVAPTRDSRFRKNSSTVFFAMTHLEAQVVEAMRAGARERGWKGDATTGDGVLVRPVGYQAWEKTPGELCRDLEGHVHAATGVKVALAMKRLDNTRVADRAWPHLRIVPWQLDGANGETDERAA